MSAVRPSALLALVALSATGCLTPEPATSAPTTKAASAGVVPIALNAPLEASFARWEKEGPTGDDEHRARLQDLATAIRGRLAADGKVDVLFVCTHNSRRSHMAQLLALAAARRKGVAGITTFSGGTEVTAFNPRAVAALQRAGFEIPSAEGANPRYAVSASPGVAPSVAFSKKIADPPNPTTGFVVVMTCSQADAACPYVAGAAARVPVHYEDPKSADGTPEETARYDERVAQIGRDMAWVFASVSGR